ncbi:MLO-like protein 1 [Asparagus officinalis]|uniref:MLO-like protein 1 n=1 Tax=Asparagus officinalis TaxID=4686 RepID=UPI00098E7249|nr:MLO-like protein 1 [Asparagus officinalis]
MAGGGGEDQVKLEFTPTWIVAAICAGVVLISLLVEHLLNFLGKLLQRKKQKALYEALQKVKSELMLLGFISLLLVVFQGTIQKVCIPKNIIQHMLPCKYSDEAAAQAFTSLIHVNGRRLLASSGSGSICKKGKVPVLSVEAIHEMHLFIFVLAITHVTLSGLTLFFGGLKMRQWRRWEESIQNNVKVHVSPSKKTMFTTLRDIPNGISDDRGIILSWLSSFFKQFYGSVSKSDYTTMRHYFVMTHCRGNQKFNFQTYMVRALESDFEKVVGLSWYLWILVVVLLLINAYGWHAYFWISLVPLVVLLTVGTKLEHIIIQSAHEIAEQQLAIEGGLAVNITDDHFWFHRPRIMLFFIHFILFQNAFEVAVFFWVLITYGIDSCVMDKPGFIASRLLISVFVQIICSYSTLPLYAFVAQMGSALKGVIFEEHFQESLAGLSRNSKRRKSKRVVDEDSAQSSMELENASAISENADVRKNSLMELMRKYKDSVTEDIIQEILEAENVPSKSEIVEAQTVEQGDET